MTSSLGKALCRPRLLQRLVRPGCPDEYWLTRRRGNVSLEKGQYFLPRLSRARSDPDQMPTILDRMQLDAGHGASDELCVRERHIPVGNTVHHQCRANNLL